MEQITGVSVYPASPNPFGQKKGGGSQFNLALLSNASYLRLNEISNDTVKLLRTIPEFKNVKNDLTLDSEQINIDINRQLAADLDVNMADVAELISTMLGGNSPVNFNFDGQTYKVIIQLNQSQLRDISILNKLYIKSGRGRMIPLSTLIKVTNSIGPDSLPHLNRLREREHQCRIGSRCSPEHRYPKSTTTASEKIAQRHSISFYRRCKRLPGIIKQ